MSRRLLFAAGTLMVLALVAGAASAIPPSAAGCQITGSVSLVKRSDQDPSNGLDAEPLSEVRRLGAYEFKDTNIVCKGVLNGAAVDAVYSVTARGTSTGLVDPAGDSCDDARNDVPAGIYNNRFNALKTGGTGPSNLTGDVNFVRVGSDVTVQGRIDDLGTPSVNENWLFSAQLNFTPGGRAPVTGQIDRPNPDAGQIAGCVPGPNGGITTAALDGVVEIVSP